MTAKSTLSELTKLMDALSGCANNHYIQDRLEAAVNELQNAVLLAQSDQRNDPAERKRDCVDWSVSNQYERRKPLRKFESSNCSLSDCSRVARHRSFRDDVKDGKSDERKISSTKHKFLDVLKRYFGHDSFKPLQRKIIHTVLLEKRDCCVAMATGAGKSLCYQFPAVYSQKCVVVISPLISLMKDQVQALRNSNIEACFLGSAQTKSLQIKKGLLSGRYRLLYLSPEYAIGSGMLLLQELGKEAGIILFAIDEAHCISEWGPDFREAYGDLGKLKDLFPEIPFMALTAVATSQVQNEIIKSLHLTTPAVIRSSFDRPNLYFEVFKKTNSIETDLERVMGEKDNKPTFEGSTIIYCLTRQMCQSVLETLKKEIKVACVMYHAGMNMRERKSAHKQFMEGSVDVIVSTVAFGMGIDKPNVRRVIHYGLPKDMESYYQEAGRAGRDGLRSVCQIFHGPSDIFTIKYLLKDIQNRKFRHHKLQMVEKMRNYVRGDLCRRLLLLSHLEGKEWSRNTPNKDCCDVCTKKAENDREEGKKDSENEAKDERTNCSAEAKLLFGCIETVDGKYPKTVIIYLIRGSNNQKLPEDLKSNEFYGKGRDKPESWWRNFFDSLTAEGYLVSGKPFPVHKFGLTKKGRDWMAELKSANPTSFLIELRNP